MKGRKGVLLLLSNLSGRIYILFDPRLDFIQESADIIRIALEVTALPDSVLLGAEEGRGELFRTMSMSARASPIPRSKHNHLLFGLVTDLIGGCDIVILPTITAVSLGLAHEKR